MHEMRVDGELVRLMPDDVLSAFRKCGLDLDDEHITAEIVDTLERLCEV